MTNNVAQDITTDAVACDCGSDECYFCEPFAGMTEEEVLDRMWACPKCDASFSQPHEEGCRYGLAAAGTR